MNDRFIARNSLMIPLMRLASICYLCNKHGEYAFPIWEGPQKEFWQKQRRGYMSLLENMLVSLSVVKEDELSAWLSLTPASQFSIERTGIEAYVLMPFKEVCRRLIDVLIGNCRIMKDDSLNSSHGDADAIEELIRQLVEIARIVEMRSVPG